MISDQLKENEGRICFYRGKPWKILSFDIIMGGMGSALRLKRISTFPLWKTLYDNLRFEQITLTPKRCIVLLKEKEI